MIINVGDGHTSPMSFTTRFPPSCSTNMEARSLVMRVPFGFPQIVIGTITTLTLTLLPDHQQYYSHALPHGPRVMRHCPHINQYMLRPLSIIHLGVRLTMRPPLNILPPVPDARARCSLLFTHKNGKLSSFTSAVNPAQFLQNYLCSIISHGKHRIYHCLPSMTHLGSLNASLKD